MLLVALALAGLGLAACDPPDPIMFTGTDTNSTAVAVQALDAIGVTAPEASALDDPNASFVRRMRTRNASPGLPGSPSVNVTACVPSAIKSSRL